MLNGYKSPLKSLGVLGGAGGVLVGLAGLVGVTVSPDDVSQARDLVISAVTLVSGPWRSTGVFAPKIASP